MSVQRLPDQPPDCLGARPDVSREPKGVDVFQQRLRQPQAERLLGYGFCFHVTDITSVIDVRFGNSVSISDITDAVNGTAPRWMT
jgi:hypothetical protein